MCDFSRTFILDHYSPALCFPLKCALIKCIFYYRFLQKFWKNLSTQCDKEYITNRILFHSFSGQNIIWDDSEYAKVKIRGYFCHFCDKHFSRRHHLIRHERVHTGEKPYSCETCGKNFGDSSAFLKHKRLHEEPSYTCELCGKKFTERARFRYHHVVCGQPLL